jgi:hypothetical protein
MDAPREFADVLKEWEQVRADIAFLRAFRNLEVITGTTAGKIGIQYQPGSENAVLDLRSLTPTGAPPNDGLPDQAGNAGKALLTDGTSLSWGASGGATDYTRVIRTTDQAITTATQTAVTFTSATDNPSGLWVGGTPTRITVPTAGVWSLGIEVQWETNGTGLRWMILEINSTLGNVTPSVTQSPLASDQTHQAMSVDQRLAANDYAILKVYQASGGNLNVRAAVITAVRLGD